MPVFLFSLYHILRILQRPFGIVWERQSTMLNMKTVTSSCICVGFLLQLFLSCDILPSVYINFRKEQWFRPLGLGRGQLKYHSGKSKRFSYATFILCLYFLHRGGSLPGIYTRMSWYYPYLCYPGIILIRSIQISFSFEIFCLLVSAFLLSETILVITNCSESGCWKQPEWAWKQSWK